MNDFKYGIDASEYESDAFSDLLQMLQLKVEIYHNAKVCGDWRINEHKLGATCFHLVTLGDCLLDVPGYIKTMLSCGDLVIFPKELTHSMTSLALDNETKTSDNNIKQVHLPLHQAKSVEGTGMLCGEVTFHHKSSTLLLADLPPVFVLPKREDMPWMGFLGQMIMTESLSPNPASKTILDKLSEMLFTYALRQYLSENTDRIGLLALYGHERLTKAIYAIHRAPEKDWSLQAMADQALLSRTVFAETFKSVSGWTAGQYLTWWRMQLAWSKLSRGASVANTADFVGYRSESAFSRAFQKTFSVTAGQVRRGLF